MSAHITVSTANRTYTEKNNSPRLPESSQRVPGAGMQRQTSKRECCRYHLVNAVRRMLQDTVAAGAAHAHTRRHAHRRDSRATCAWSGGTSGDMGVWGMHVHQPRGPRAARRARCAAPHVWRPLPRQYFLRLWLWPRRLDTVARFTPPQLQRRCHAWRLGFPLQPRRRRLWSLLYQLRRRHVLQVGWQPHLLMWHPPRQPQHPT